MWFMGQVGTVCLAMPMCNYAVHIMCKGLPEEQLQDLHIYTALHRCEDYSYLPMDTANRLSCLTITPLIPRMWGGEVGLAYIKILHTTQYVKSMPKPVAL